MFALRVLWLTGRVYAARFDEGDDKRTAEWPPHPSRLFNALVAAWGETGKDDAQAAALQWLERCAPPRIVCGREPTARASLTAFVPVNDNNDQFHRTKGTFFPTISETVLFRRDRKPRRFPSLTPDSLDVWFVWSEDLAEQHAEALRCLLRHVTSLGHSASLVAIYLESPPSEASETWWPHEDGEARLRVPSAGRLQTLEEQFARFKESPVKTNRPSKGATVRYTSRLSRSEVVPSSVFRDMLILRRSGGDRLPLASTYQLMTAFRGAVMSHFPEGQAPEFVSGHTTPDANGKPQRSERPHLAFIPLADVGHGHARGHIMGVAALIPRTLTEAEVEVATAAVASVEKLTMARAGAWSVEPVLIGDAPRTLNPSSWIGPSKQWATVTPVVYDRFPSDRWGGEAEAMVALACERVSLPRPLVITLSDVSPHLGVPIARAFPAAPARPGKPCRLHAHATLVFEHAVEGPITIGAGRYYGYGLCRPLHP